ncbi:MAG: ThuA domain-containing protein [Phycisphaerales bacterium]|nr:MAG: ThuA domain-containing protein [Phycisphaerales bacterium]
MSQLKTTILYFLLASVLPLSSFLSTAAAGADQNTITLSARSRAEVADRGGRFTVIYKTLTWEPSQTAVIICDMWDRHWCKGATERVAEMAPVMNEVIAKARDRGALIIHAPSGTIGHYQDHPARKRAAGAPKAANLPADIGRWCTVKTNQEKRFEYPIDQSDGGCDCEPKCKTASPWRKQIETIEISDKDAISDSGAEIWNLLESRRAKNVILMGVHTNMCVLGRPFGLRNMARFGRNVALMRDMTDTMYNSRMRPQVSHFTGTDLIVEHIEKFVCPTVTSTAFTGRPRFFFKGDKRPRVVFLSAESEYGSAESLPGFAHELQMKSGLHCDILQGSTDRTSRDRHNIPEMHDLAGADLAVVFVRRRALPPDQMKCLRDYLARGKPLIGLRTASHAFDARGDGPAGYAEWPEFDPEVLGGNYHGHYGSGPNTTVTAAPGAKEHPVLAGIHLPFTSNASLYKAGPLSGSAEELLLGAIPDQAPEPAAWTNTYWESRIFYTSLGHRDDFANPQFRRLLVNAVFWAMDKAVPK